MIVLDPGHRYQLAHLDGYATEILTFVKRHGKKYPDNVGSYEGTNIQEVLRALIDRTKYLQNQIPDVANIVVISNLQKAIWALEDRAARRHERDFDYQVFNIELEPTCKICGHIGCFESCH